MRSNRLNSLLGKMSASKTADQGCNQALEADLLPLYRRVLFDRTHRERYVADLNQRIRAAAADAGVADRL